ncbi:MAG: ATP-dependent Clp protease adaptor ClpS, partial [Phycisphaerales bacterium]|nr:ATP-dependent Clp protease adaptor ClpS [Phycisphaerales bacterium]
TPPASKPLDQYKVLLHNDDVNEMLFVVQTICEIVPMPAQKAFTVMVEAHKSGVALVAVTHLELAELYRDRFQSKGLCATIEKA